MYSGEGDDSDIGLGEVSVSVLTFEDSDTDNGFFRLDSLDFLRFSSRALHRLQAYTLVRPSSLYTAVSRYTVVESSAEGSLSCFLACSLICSCFFDICFVVVPACSRSVLNVPIRAR